MISPSQRDIRIKLQQGLLILQLQLRQVGLLVCSFIVREARQQTLAGTVDLQELGWAHRERNWCTTAIGTAYGQHRSVPHPGKAGANNDVARAPWPERLARGAICAFLARPAP
jgi:hypothetical protein